MKKTAIVIGATGLTGGYLLDTLLNDDRYATVKLFSRSSVKKKHPKIKEYFIDMFDLQSAKSDFMADEVFCCIGTTAKKTPDKELYKQIDYGIPVNAARLAKENGISTFIVMSSMGANSRSTVFYNRLKGTMEDDVRATGIANTYMVRPSLIGGERNESRPGEYFGKQLFKILNPLMIGSLKKYRLIHPSKIAKAMVRLANDQFDSTIVESDVLQKLGA
ncbi:NAD(P)H-binding protein [Spongiivirga citrea]|uniref:NAD(P)H-binding protein n=1 Tax=Spongiivirga citrea TaxID=1481457 RepID=A0A6M0CTT1_9FLAO|nr:NAD(P)H-binding protein [Spongiivirga citrea]